MTGVYLLWPHSEFDVRRLLLRLQHRQERNTEETQYEEFFSLAFLLMLLSHFPFLSSLTDALAQYLAAAFQSSALFFLLTLNVEHFFELRDSQLLLKYENMSMFRGVFVRIMIFDSHATRRQRKGAEDKTDRIRILCAGPRRGEKHQVGCMA
jgi:hypothetical protein